MEDLSLGFPRRKPQVGVDILKAVLLLHSQQMNTLGLMLLVL